MEIRQATADDGAAIRSIARASFASSYDFVDESVVEDAISEWYGADTLDEELAAPTTIYLVVAAGDPVAFSKSALVDRGEDPPVGEILWVHVHPDHRGRGIGTSLLEETETVLEDRGAAEIRGLVLEPNDAGTAFYEAHGYEAATTREVDVGTETFVERAYVKYAAETGPEPMERRALDDGSAVFVDREDPERGSQGPFFPVYRDADREQRYGFCCGNCGGFDVAVNTMERIECNDCGNFRKPTRWDAAYL